MRLLSPMTIRVLARSFRVRKGRTLTALLALTTAAAVATAMLNLYVDLEAKLTTEFRKVGANVMVTAADRGPLSAESLAAVQGAVPGDGIAVPMAFAVAKTKSGRPIVVAGVPLDAARKANPWWAVEGEGAALVGVRAKEALRYEDDGGLLMFNGRPFRLESVATLRTGGPEDSRIYFPMAQFSAWVGVQPSLVEVTVQGSAAEVTGAVGRLRSAAPGLDVRPIRQVAEAETRVLGKTKAVLLASTAVIIVLVAVCVIASLTSSVLERRKDFAVMKALGSSQGEVSAIFLTEALLLALAASLLGFAIGSGAAAAIGRINFNAAVVPRLSVLPPVLIGGMVVALVSAALPLLRLQKIQPAVMLKGD